MRGYLFTSRSDYQQDKTLALICMEKVLLHYSFNHKKVECVSGVDGKIGSQ